MAAVGLLVAALLGTAAARVCPTFPDTSEEAWTGFPKASDGQLVLVHGVPFTSVGVQTVWASTEPVQCTATGDGSNCEVSPPTDLSHFGCEVMGATGSCLMTDKGPVATLNFPNEYTTQSFGIKVSDPNGDCQTVEINREEYVYSKYVALAPLLIVLILTPLTRELYSSLGLGGLAGTWILKRDLWTAWLSFWHDRVQDQLTGFFAMILWTMFLMGGIGGLALRSGGVKDIGLKTAKLIKDSFLGQAVVFCLGFVIFIGDYSSAIIVGFSVQPITEAMRVSREKLSFLVDCTASPVAGIMPLSTWIAFELSQIQIGLDNMQNPPEDGAFILFTRSISRRFYSFFMLTLVAATFLLGRDWGYMYRAEARARTGGGTVDRASEEVTVPAEAPDGYTMVATENFVMIATKSGIPHRWWNAVVPFFLIFAIFTPLIFYSGVQSCPDEGWNASVRDILGCANAFAALHWTCGTVIVVQIFMYACQWNKEWGGCLLRPRESIDAALNGGMLYIKAMICLLLAFTYARTVRDLLLNKLLVDALGDGVTPAELPAVIFVLCALFSLATGTSWGTMSVFMPVVLPLAEVVGANSAAGVYDDNLLLTTIAAVLGGAVWGDHCSPISDTTILSAAACQCSLLDHTKTQLPYAIFCGVMSILLGFMPAGAGLPAGVCILLGLVLIPALHYAISMLGLVIPGFGGSIPVFVPSGAKEEGEGFLIGEGPLGTVAAFKNMLGREVAKEAAPRTLGSAACVMDGKVSDGNGKEVAPTLSGTRSPSARSPSAAAARSGNGAWPEPAPVNADVA